MHKNPVGARFIIASRQCVTKELSKDVASLFKLFLLQIKNYHRKSQYFSGVKTFWVIDTNINVINTLKSISKKKRAKKLSSKDPIKVDAHGNAYWCENKDCKDKKYFKVDVIKAVKFLLENCFFTVGNKVLRQIVGIPMGGDPAPFFFFFFFFWLTFNK